MIETVTDDFFQLIEIINKAIDFVAKDEYSGKPIIKFGLDQALDASKYSDKIKGQVRTHLSSCREGTAARH